MKNWTVEKIDAYIHDKFVTYFKVIDINSRSLISDYLYEEVVKLTNAIFDD